MRSLLLILTSKGSDVEQRLAALPQIRDVKHVRGAYDILAIAETEDVAAFQDAVKRYVPGVEAVSALVPKHASARRKSHQVSLELWS